MVVGIILANGTSTRFGADKLQKRIGKRSVWEHALMAFVDHPKIDLTVWVNSGALPMISKPLTNELPHRVCGGDTRSESCMKALEYLDNTIGVDSDTRVLIHDAARPLVSPQLITACVQALDQSQAVVPVVESHDTPCITKDGRLLESLNRADVYGCQTPQGFHFGLIYAAYKAHQGKSTDDCGVLRQYAPDEPIAVIPGEVLNRKITTPEDLTILTSLAEARGD